MLYFTITSITFQTPKRVEMARVVPADLKPCYLSKDAFFFSLGLYRGVVLSTQSDYLSVYPSVPLPLTPHLTPYPRCPALW